MNRRIARPAYLLGIQMLAGGLLVSCGGSGGGDEVSGDPPPGDPQTATGFFKDSAVEGLDYVSGAQQGITGSDGAFTYEVGENVTFSIGGVVIGTAVGKALVTPIDLVPGGNDTSIEVQNIVRFLMMLDSDSDPENGISISPAVRTIAKTWHQVDFATLDLDAAVTAILSDTTSVDGVAHSLPSELDAQTHFEDTFRCLYSGIFRGTYSGGDHGQFGAWISPLNGNVDGFVWNSNIGSGGAVSGEIPISIDEDVAFVSGGGAFGASYSGNLTSPDHVEGSWNNSSAGVSGTFSGNRIGNDSSSSIEYRFSGSYEGFSGSTVAIGYYAINIDVSNNVTGAAYEVLSDAEFPITGSVTGTSISATASDGTHISGTINKDTKNMNGSFSNSDTEVSGTYTGRGCKLN